MNITQHCRHRYLERIKGITDTTQRTNAIYYQSKNINKDIIDMYQDSVCVYENGFFSKNNPSKYITTKYMYHKDTDTCLVIGGKDNIITIYKPDNNNYKVKTHILLYKINEAQKQLITI